jgi:hypothetical protein
MPILIATARATVTDRHGKRIEMPPPEELRGHRYHDLRLKEMAVIAAETNQFMALTYLTVAVATAMLANITTAGLFMSIHTATPGNTGASEIAANVATGYTQAARPAISWSAFSTDHQTSGGANATQTYTMGASWTPAAIPYFGIWGASSAGTYYAGGPTSGLSGSIPAGANVTFTSAVTLTIAG